MKPIDPTYDNFLIPINFAYTPQILNFLTLIPLLARPIELLLAVWSLLSAIVAIHQGLDVSTRQATLICLIGCPLTEVGIGFVQILEQKLVNLTS